MNTEEPRAKKEKPHPKLNMGICNANCLLIFPLLAQLIGLNEAIVLQQLHYWLCINCERESGNGQYQTHFHDGRWWAYNAVREWQAKDFPFWSCATITRTLKKLEADGFITGTGKYHFPWAHRGDRTKWYTINYDFLLAKFAEGGAGFHFTQNTPAGIRQISWTEPPKYNMLIADILPQSPRD